MQATKLEHAVVKESVLKNLNDERGSVLMKYEKIFIGKNKTADFLRYELISALSGPFPGAIGLLLRKLSFPYIFGRVGKGAVWGRNIALRHPSKIKVGDRTAVDDECLLDARGAGDEGITIGSDVLIARATIIQAKAAPITIGDRCVISSQCQLSSAGGIVLGKSVMVGGQSYIGGGRYHTEDRSIPIMDQGLYSFGPVVIEDDVWMGAGVTVLDGVRIGTGSVIGSGAVIREDVPPYTVVTPYQKLVMLPREGAEIQQ
jgi:acetyltransferase-like isoleucine patch superfamily enzyme